MARWLTYAKERFPLGTYLLLCCGLVMSGSILHRHSTDTAMRGLGLFGLMLFFFELRLMDEYKDREKDRTAHPTRPIPRGLLGEGEVRTAIAAILGAMFAFAGGLSLVSGNAAAVCYFILTIHLVLMYKEFFVGGWLAERPFLYAASHQAICLAMAAYAVSLFSPEKILTLETLGFGLLVLGAFFTYEICRKLNPDAHPVLKTYLTTYGYGKTLALTVGSTSVAVFGASLIQLDALVFPFSAGVLLAFLLLRFKPAQFKLGEAAAAALLLVAMWAPFLWQTAQALRGGAR